jgi:hypothetical protein
MHEQIRDYKCYAKNINNQPSNIGMGPDALPSHLEKQIV